MADNTLDGEFPWLRRDASPILGDARPRTTKAVLDKDGLWLEVFRDWIESEHPDHSAGLTYLASNNARVESVTDQLTQAYQTFYGTAGRMKDVARKDANAARQRYPWAPANVRSLIGTARPKTFDDLADDGPRGSWYPAFRSWLTFQRPFEGADSWLDWHGRQESESAAWTTSLDRLVTDFAKEIELLKSALRERHGNKAERAVRQVGEAATEAGRQAKDAVRDAPRKIDEAAERFANTRLVPGGDEARKATVPPAKKQADVPAKAAAPQAAQQAGVPQAAQQAAAPAAAQPAAAPAKKAPPVPPRRPQVPDQVRRQLQLASPLLQSAPQYSGWVEWLGQRFAGFGGALAEEAGSLQGYKALVDGDAAYLGAQMATLADHVARSDDATLFALLSAMRGAVYRLAWNVDLAYPNYYGGWPHQRLWDVVQAISGSGSTQLRYAGGRALYGLLADIETMYDGASGLLDVAKQVVDARVPGYQLDDGAVPWDVHQVVSAKNEMSALTSTVADWAGQEPAEEEDGAAVEEAAQSAFGMPYENLLQVG